MTEDNNRISKTVTLRVPRQEVWRALTDPAEFGEWFGVLLSGDFSPGEELCGPLTHPDYEGVEVRFKIEKMEPDRLLSWRWHPNAIDSEFDYSNEPTTLVTFTLDDAAEGTHLTVTESGFERLPESRRDEARRANDEGWTQQLKAIEQHVGAVA